MSCINRRGTLQILSVDRLGNQAILVGNSQLQLNEILVNPCALWDAALFRFIPRTSGYYLVTVQATFTSCQVGRTYSVYVYVNPAIPLTISTVTGAILNGTITINAQCLIWVNKNGFLDAGISTSNPAGGTVQGGNHSTFLEAVKVN